MAEEETAPEEGTPQDVAPETTEVPAEAASAVPQKTSPESLDDGLEAESGADVDINLDVLLDVPLSMSLEVGRSRLSIRDLLQLNQGSVVELDRVAGEPMDVIVNGTLVAHGEVVVVNDKFGIRLTDVISPAERIKQLQ